ncbi:MAG: methionine gamma-lyase family protein [Clostridia bacterium]|nr:methionine gamma-lyase family protein [Clostridia bacterium]
MKEQIIKDCELKLKEQFEKLDDIAQFNQEKVLNAFKKNKIALRHFYGTNGYGYGDDGKFTLNQLLADIFKAEDAILSPYIASGTHALSLCLFAILRPDDEFVSITGKPYDTLTDVINGKNNGSLKDYGVKFSFIDLKNDKIDFDEVKKYLLEHNPKMVYLQRSRGYDWRKALSIDEIEEAVKNIRSFGYNGCIMLDNCYGEFVEKKEAIEVGVNLLAGSMIKNIGGGIAPTGGYVVGDKKYIDLVANRLIAPSVGNEVGSYAYGYRLFYQGLFMAPHIVKEALKGSLLFGEVLSRCGYETSPKSGEMPYDITRSIKLNDEKKLISFIQKIQEYSPVDSYLTLEPWDMPGYTNKVIMAAGCFVQGSSIELSADAPIKPPYIAYMQGGLTYEHSKIVLKNIEL